MDRRFLSGLPTAVILILLASFPSTHAANIEDVTFQSHGVVLAGDIVFPEGQIPVAALILVDGSGKTERRLDLAHALASEGFAVLTYDKRGVGRSGGVYWGIDNDRPNIATVNLNLLADDAVAAMDVLAKNPRLRRVPTGFWGLAKEAG